MSQRSASPVTTSSIKAGDRVFSIPDLEWGLVVNTLPVPGYTYTLVYVILDRDFKDVIRPDHVKFKAPVTLQGRERYDDELFLQGEALNKRLDAEVLDENSGFTLEMLREKTAPSVAPQPHIIEHTVNEGWSFVVDWHEKGKSFPPWPAVMHHYYVGAHTREFAEEFVKVLTGNGIPGAKITKIGE